MSRLTIICNQFMPPSNEVLCLACLVPLIFFLSDLVSPNSEFKKYCPFILGYRNMTSVLRREHEIKCTRAQVQQLLNQHDPEASLARRFHRLVCKSFIEDHKQVSVVIILVIICCSTRLSESDAWNVIAVPPPRDQFKFKPMWWDSSALTTM